MKEEEHSRGENIPALPRPLEAAGDVETDGPAEHPGPEPPRLRRGLVGWIWYFATPCAAVAFLGCVLNEAWGWATGAGFCVVTGLRLNSLYRALDRARAALQPQEIDRDRIGTLVDALDGPGRRFREIARLRLLCLLPGLRETDAGRLTEDQRGCLQRRLTPLRAATDPELTLAILKALESVGDGDALPDVERLAKLPAATRSLRRVRQAARACLPMVEGRVAQAFSHSLPRAGEAHTGSWTPLRGTRSRPTAASPAGAPAEARRGAAALTAEERAAVDRVNARIRELERERGKQQPGMRLPFLIATWLIIVPYLGFQTFDFLFEGHPLMALLFGALTGVATQLYRLTLTSRHVAFTWELARLDDVQAVGQLVDALSWPDAEIRSIALRALTRLLPRLHAGHASLLDRVQRATLYRMLTMENAVAHTEFLIALLKALEQVGDTAAVPYVQELANSHPPTARQRRVRDAAHDCMFYLRECAALNDHSLTLLRASSASGLPSESLVRPASGLADADPERLLRPADPEENAAPQDLPASLVSPDV